MPFLNYVNPKAFVGGKKGMDRKDASYWNVLIRAHYFCSPFQR